MALLEASLALNAEQNSAEIIIIHKPTSFRSGLFYGMRIAYHFSGKVLKSELCGFAQIIELIFVQ